MFKKFNGANSDSIKEYEELIQMELPQDYREFLLNTNGGCFEDELHTFWVEELKENIGIDVLFGFNQERSLSLSTWYNEYREDLKGIFLWDHCLELEQSTEEDCLYRIADSFEEFLSKM